MLRRLFEWLIGRKEPVLHESDRDRRLRNLEIRVKLITGERR